MTHNPAEALREALNEVVAIKDQPWDWAGTRADWLEDERSELRLMAARALDAYAAALSPAPAGGEATVTVPKLALEKLLSEAQLVCANSVNDKTYECIERLRSAGRQFDNARYDMARAAEASARPCTCHPSDNPPVPCPQKYAYSECVAAATPSPDVAGVVERLGCLADRIEHEADFAESGYAKAAPLRKAITLLESLSADKARMEEALTPSAETKAAYIGEFTFSLNAGLDEFGDDHIIKNVQVPWTTIKEIMAAIRCALTPKDKA